MDWLLKNRYSRVNDIVRQQDGVTTLQAVVFVVIDDGSCG